jgi:hypothetical protein
MRTAIIAAAAAAIVAPALVLTSPVSASPASISPLNASCGKSGPNKDNHRVSDAPVSGAVNQRSGSSTGCAIPGVLQPSDDAIYFCWTFGNDDFTWTYLQNIRTGVRGWSRDTLLKERGAVTNCGF